MRWTIGPNPQERRQNGINLRLSAGLLPVLGNGPDAVRPAYQLGRRFARGGLDGAMRFLADHLPILPLPIGGWPGRPAPAGGAGEPHFNNLTNEDRGSRR